MRSPSIAKSTAAPGWSPTRSRRSFGITTWPLEPTRWIIPCKYNSPHLSDQAASGPNGDYLPTDHVSMVLALASGLVGGLAVGPLVRLALPVEDRRQVRAGLLVGIATAAIMGPSQYVFVQILGQLRMPVEFWIVRGVPVWPFAATLAALIVVFGGSVRTGALAGLMASATAATWFVKVGSIALFALFPPTIWPIFLAAITLVAGMRLGGGAYLSRAQPPASGLRAVGPSLSASVIYRDIGKKDGRPRPPLSSPPAGDFDHVIEIVAPASAPSGTSSFQNSFVCPTGIDAGTCTFIS